ncbi:hypothetical protein Cflav_PD1005 [Pedosphaera parvula Ellin514]|uniref:Uncharacterized protein n=1 Tax=Pedosphaera parvula (strain Ellin514) TaxID=320771 RepID=B9XPD7_PEDPL|nr:hypothetical protein Cflav_PD1005 [Pedosphaera parvula Ellin514]
MRDWPYETTATGWDAISSAGAKSSSSTISSGKNEKSSRDFVSSSLHMGRGFLFPTNKRDQKIMDKHDGFMKALKCRECGREYPLTATHVCEFDFGPLEVAYDYDRIKKSLTKSAIASRPQSMWRYRECSPSPVTPQLVSRLASRH